MIFSKKVKQFIALAESHSYACAAEKISVSPSALSYGISELESKLGTTLVLRKRTGIELTRSGKQLYQLLSPVHTMLTSAVNKLKQEEVKIVISIDGIYFPRLIEKLALMMAHCGDNFSVVSATYPDIEEEIISGNSDIVINTSLDMPGQSSTLLHRLPVSPESVGLMVHNDKILQHGSVKSLLNHSVLYQRDSALIHPIYMEIQDKMEQAGYNCTFTGLPEIADVHSALLSGMGATLMPKSMMEHPALQNDDMYYIDMPFPFSIFLHRGIYFRKERFNDLIDIASCFQ